MNLLHDDHATVRVLGPCVVVAKFDLQEIGNPHTTLARGWAYCLYSFHTIDVRGDKGSAE